MNVQGNVPIDTACPYKAWELINPRLDSLTAVPGTCLASVIATYEKQNATARAVGSVCGQFVSLHLPIWRHMGQRSILSALVSLLVSPQTLACWKLGWKIPCDQLVFFFPYLSFETCWLPFSTASSLFVDVTYWMYDNLCSYVCFRGRGR